MVFYFSGTGNSLCAAEKIAEMTGDSLTSITDILYKEDKRAYELADGEKVGFVFPVYFYGIPAPVLDFLRRFSFDNLNDNYFYLVLTCGGSTAASGEHFSDLCAARGWDLKYQNAVRFPDNYTIAFKAASADKIEKRLEEADAALTEIAEQILCDTEGDWNRIKGAVPHLMSTALYPFYSSARKTKHFSCDNNKCISCGMCAKNCPVGAISTNEDGRPVWEAKRCALCLRCLNTCPTAAVLYDGKAGKDGRYKNPRVYSKEQK